MPKPAPMFDFAKLKHLATKPSLTEIERLELEEMLNVRASLKAAQVRTGLAGARRKLENRMKYRLGALAMNAGLANWTDLELIGAFAAVAAVTTTQRRSWTSDGARISGVADPAAPLTGDFHV